LINKHVLFSRFFYIIIYDTSRAKLDT